MNSIQGRTSFLRHQIFLLLAVSLVLLWSVVAWDYRRTEDQALEQIRRETAALAMVFAKQAETTFRDVDHTLLVLRDAWLRSPATFAEEIAHHQDLLDGTALQIAIMDAKGLLVFSNLGLPEQPLSLADREHFKVHRDRPDDKQFISRPVQGRISGKWSIQLTRPIFDQGRFAGVIAISVDPEYFVRFYQEVGLGKNGAARMIRDTGEVMARSQEQDKYIGKVINTSPYADAGAPQTGSFRRRAQVDGVDRLSSYYRLPERGVTVVIGPSVDEMLAPARAQQRKTVFSAGLVTLLMLLISWQLLRSIASNEKSRHAVQKQQERLSLATLHNGVGIWDWNLVTQQMVWDDSMFALYRLQREDFSRTDDNWRRFLHPDDLERVDMELHVALSEGTPFDTEFRVRWPSGEIRHIKAIANIFRDEHGTPSRMLGANTDITERKKAEEKLKLAANVFSQAREGIMITTVDGSIIDVNEAFTRISGYRREEVVGHPPSLLKSGLQGKEFYATLWRDLIDEGHWVGEIWNRRKNGEVYAEMLTISALRDNQGQVQQYFALFSDITRQKEHEYQLEHMAHYDVLTSLPNRILLADRLHQSMVQALRRKQRLAVCYLDLDGFKAVNDRNGHETGDQLLVVVANRMKECLREGDTLARIGGDEFVAVLLDLKEDDAGLVILDRLLAASAQPLAIGDLVLQVSASLGVTFFPQEDDVSADSLLRQADHAMYQAKQSGKNRYQVFEAEETESSESSLQTVS